MFSKVRPSLGGPLEGGMGFFRRDGTWTEASMPAGIFGRSDTRIYPRFGSDLPRHRLRGSRWGTSSARASFRQGQATWAPLRGSCRPGGPLPRPRVGRALYCLCIAV